MLRIQNKSIMKHFILIAITILFSSLEMYSQVFTVQLSGGDKLFFNITDSTKKKVEIVRVRTMNGAPVTLPSGHLEIPSTVKFNDDTYYVRSIGESAFADAVDLTSVSIPSSVGQIEERAFAGCMKLSVVVFPSCTPSIGEAAFEKCSSISSVSFGSDWTSLDLGMFSDSDSLKTVYVPARTVKITGVKRLPNLQEITVDPNNKMFSSHDGLLYSKDGLTFYACPCAHKGFVSLETGTEIILDGAFRGCRMVESIDVPVSTHEFAFDEFEGCALLSSIILRAEIPPVTSKWNGSAVFAIKSPGENCSVFVPKEHYSRYQTSICSAEGSYETLSGRRRTAVTKDGMIGVSAIKRIKKQR